MDRSFLVEERAQTSCPHYSFIIYDFIIRHEHIVWSTVAKNKNFMLGLFSAAAYKAKKLCTRLQPKDASHCKDKN
ncbi:unnamed protein product, partial [Sphenostylis stenocarpa]